MIWYFIPALTVDPRISVPSGLWFYQVWTWNLSTWMLASWTNSSSWCNPKVGTSMVRQRWPESTILQTEITPLPNGSGILAIDKGSGELVVAINHICSSLKDVFFFFLMGKFQTIHVAQNREGTDQKPQKKKGLYPSCPLPPCCRVIVTAT